jgi:hypothetical protein
VDCVLGVTRFKESARSVVFCPVLMNTLEVAPR